MFIRGDLCPQIKTSKVQIRDRVIGWDDDAFAQAALFAEEGPQVALAVHNMVVGLVFDLVGGFSLVVEHAGVGGFLVEVGFEGLEDLDAAGIGVLGVVERGQSLGIGKGATLWLSSQLS